MCTWRMEMSRQNRGCEPLKEHGPSCKKMLLHGVKTNQSTCNRCQRVSDCSSRLKGLNDYRPHHVLHITSTKERVVKTQWCLVLPSRPYTILAMNANHTIHKHVCRDPYADKERAAGTQNMTSIQTTCDDLGGAHGI